MGAEYEDAKTDYTGEGVNQLAEMIFKLKIPIRSENHSQRADPKDLKIMALPPLPYVCTILCVVPERSGWVERLGEIALPAFTNGAATWRYALLMHMLAHVYNLILGTFTHTMGDAHLYADHIDSLKV